MSSDIAVLIKEIQDFDCQRLGGTYYDKLDDLTKDLPGHPEAVSAVPVLFRLIERNSEYDLGNPGVVVHTIETIGNYHSELIESLKRKPTELTIWMVNRILNSEISYGQRRRFTEILRQLADDSLIPADLSETASEYLDHQDRRSTL